MADPERTARARIRDAALARFAEHGFARTHLKDIAADAGVTTPLITHHFGSKDALRAECDRHVAALIREQKSAGVGRDPDAGLLQQMRAVYAATPIMAYLARTLSDSSPHVDELVDLIVEDAVDYTEAAVADGIIRPSERLREQVIAVTIWQLGAMALHQHVTRLSGVDLLGTDPQSLARWSSLISEILAVGMIEPDYYAKLRPALESATTPHQTDPDTGGTP
ncbi:MAG: TetR family transcriptional regulator [Actinomycetia bacterium]|nr:TetR family transcriptional regulator [Actinomycetes bacterium]